MNDTQIPFLAPGCYGSALLFQKTNMVCAACPFAAQCEPVHQMALQAMRDELGIGTPVPKKARSSEVRVGDEVVTDETTMALPKKVRELLARLDRETLDIAGKMKNGVNPFSGIRRYRFMMVACHLILRLEIPVTHKVISVGLMKTMGWASGTADAHARMATQALEHVGAIEKSDGIFSVRRNK